MNLANAVLALALAPAAIGQAGCSTLDDWNKQTGTIRVIAPPGKCWSGANAVTTSGCGSTSLPIKSAAIIVGNAQKQTPGSWTLTLTLEIGGKVVDRSTTSAEFGIATVSE